MARWRGERVAVKVFSLLAVFAIFLSLYRCFLKGVLHNRGGELVQRNRNLPNSLDEVRTNKSTSSLSLSGCQ